MNHTYFIRAQHAFTFLYHEINTFGHQSGNGTKALYNIGFYINNPKANDISVPFRNWSKEYATREWEWYLSENRSVETIKKFAPIWDKMHPGNNLVNSNYGYQWARAGQLNECIKQLRIDPNTRQACISLFDGKEKYAYTHDTPCTMSICFYILKSELCMSVNMRSNDLWFGFCNDQFCFSNLQMLVAKELGLRVGTYYHFAANLHLYEEHWSK